MTKFKKYKFTIIDVYNSDSFTVDYDGRCYTDEVVNALNEIGGFFPHFYSHLEKTRKIIICYHFKTENMIFTNVDGCVRLRVDYENIVGEDRLVSYRDAFGESLRNEMEQAKITPKALAIKLKGALLPSWNEKKPALNPFLDRKRKLDEIEATIENWVVGYEYPTREEMDVLVLPCVFSMMSPGPGCNAKIYFDPAYNDGRPSVVGLLHELTHAYYSVNGMNRGLAESSTESAGGRHFELMAVGMKPYDQKRYSENKIRTKLGCVRRTAIR